MKKNFNRIIALLLVVISCFSFMTACQKPTENNSLTKLYDPEAGIDRQTVLAQIVSNGASDYRIVHSAKANSTEIYAAQEMQYFIAESTGVKLPIITDGMASFNPEKLICIGKNTITTDAGISVDYAEFKEDGFVLKTKGTNLFILGGGDRGTLYGVYDYLEKIIGIRFLDSDVTHIPKCEKLELYSMDVKEIPYFEYRGVLATSTMYGVDEAYYARTRNNHEHILQHTTEDMTKYGGTLEWYSKINPTHNTLTYVPYEEYGAEHPEMFAAQGILSGGTRDICFTNGLTEDGKLDESMEVSTLKVAIESLKKFAKDDPDCYHMFGHMDTGDMCNCDGCTESHQKYGMAGTYFRFANALLKEVQKWANDELDGKKIQLVVFAYSASDEAPVDVNKETGKYEVKDPSIKPIENIHVRLAPIHSNRYYAMGEGTHMTKYKDWLEKWSAVADKFMVWAYSVDFHRSMWYFPTHQAMVKTLQEYKDLGVTYMMLQLIWQEENDWQSIMKNYVYLKLLWNPNRDVNALIEEFCYLYYGEQAGKKVLEMMGIYDQYFYLANLETNGSFTTSYLTFTNPTYNKYEHVYAGYELIEQAMDLVQNDNSLNENEKQEYIRRLKVVKLTPLFMIAYNSSYYFMGDSITQKKWVENFISLAKELGVVYIGENTGSQTEFLFENFIKDYWGYGA